MFKRKKNKMNPNLTDTLIGQGSVFEGKIKSEASIRIEGKITGDVECVGDVTIGESGEVKSNIFARNVILAGTVHGNIQTTEKLTISPTGTLHGNSSAKILIIEDGALFDGASRMTTKNVEENNDPINNTQKQSFNKSPAAM